MLNDIRNEKKGKAGIGGKRGVRVVEPVCLVSSDEARRPKNRGARQSPLRIQA